MTIREFAEEVGISTLTAHYIQTEDLFMKRVVAKFVPKLLMAGQKQLRVEVSQAMLDSTNSDLELMNDIISGDESWVYGYHPETKSQSSQWKHFPSYENTTRTLNTTSLKCFLLSTDAIDRREQFTHAYEGPRSPHARTLQ